MQHRRKLSLWIIGIALAALAAACSPEERDRNGGGGDDDDQPGGFVDAAPIDPDQTDTGQCAKVDFLFVIDNSPSMGEEQSSLISNFPQFIQVIDGYMTDTGKTLDYRIAVTTTGRNITYTTELPGLGPITQTENGDDGRFRSVSGMPRPWIERADGNVTGRFSQIANVGTQGPSWEMQLQASQLALSTQAANGGPNAGFLRDDALLAVVVITDEDDCSRDDSMWTSSAFEDACKRTPESFVQFFDALKGDRGRWATAVIAIPPGAGECGGESSSEGDRLESFVEAAGGNAVFANICTGNLAGALQQAVQTFSVACDNFPPID